MFGIRLVEDAKCTEQRWVFPTERFVIYEPKDERWCRFFGIGEEKTLPTAYMLGGHTLLAHPEIAAKLKARMKVPKI